MKFGFALALVLLPSFTLAQELNTGVLPTLWYSQTEVHEGDSVKIYGGIQNHSGTRLTGIAAFYIDGEEVSRTNFISAHDTLIELTASWQATQGKHEAELRIIELEPRAEAIWSESSGKVELHVSRKLTPELVKQGAVQTAENVAGWADSLAESLASKVDEYRKSREDEKVSVAGTSTERTFKETGSQAVSSVFDLVLKFFSAALRHWPWTLGGLFVLYFALRPRS